MQFLKDETIVIARRTQQAGTDKFLASTVTSAKAHIQPLDRQRLELVGGAFGKGYVIYMDSSVDVKEGDRLKDSSSNFYKVVTGGVSKRNFGSFEHSEIIVELV